MFWSGLLCVLLGFVSPGELLVKGNVVTSVETFLALPIADVSSTAGERAPLLEALWEGVRENPFLLVATGIFFAAILHTFFASKFLKWAHHFEEQLAADVAAGKVKPSADGEVSSIRATVFHFLGEVEAVFGIWALVLFVVMCLWPGIGWNQACEYLNSRNYTEPVFVVIIMAIAATRPVVSFAGKMLGKVAAMGNSSPAAWWFSILTLAPIFGSFITEPAAMTIAALLLARQVYSLQPKPGLAYATLGLLFVNISVGGTLTNFAAPPVLMVAAKWEWSLWAMLSQFGWKAFFGIVLSNGLFWLAFRSEFARLAEKKAALAEVAEEIDDDEEIPLWVTLVHFGFMAWTVMMLLEHRLALFVAGFLFFLAFTKATARYQRAMQLRGPLFVGFFLAGLVVHGGLQGWWIGPVLGRLTEVPLFFGATLLTAFNDNAAITYLASQVPALSNYDANGVHLTGEAYALVNRLHYAVLAGAVTGGGLTVIANAPNPAGQSILGKYFPEGISPAKLFLAAIIPTVIVGACFMLIPH